MRTLLLTGPPGVGKTTVIRRLAQRLKDRRLGGFYTAELREGRERRGFCLVSFTGQETVITHVTFPKAYRVSKMECLAPGLVAAIERLLDSGCPLVATVAAKGGGLIAAVKERPEIELIQVTRENRDALPEALYRRLVAVLGSA